MPHSPCARPAASADQRSNASDSAELNGCAIDGASPLRATLNSPAPTGAVPALGQQRWRCRGPRQAGSPNRSRRRGPRLGNRPGRRCAPRRPAYRSGRDDASAGAPAGTTSRARPCIRRSRVGDWRSTIAYSSTSSKSASGKDDLEASVRRAQAVARDERRVHLGRLRLAPSRSRVAAPSTTARYAGGGGAVRPAREPMRRRSPRTTDANRKLYRRAATTDGGAAAGRALRLESPAGLDWQRSV